jgi:Terminase large subunit, T4likevirus-type, N-terminal
MKRLAFDKEKVFPLLNYDPHDGQWIIHRAPARHRLAAAGRRFGKSLLGGHELTIEALYTYSFRNQLEANSKRREFWIVGPEYSDSEKEFRVAYNDLKRLDVPFDRPGTYNNPEGGEMRISLWNGRFIVKAMSAKYPGTLVGEELSGVVMAEAAKIKELVWTKYIRPTLADQRGWSLFLSTPEGKNWFYRLWQKGQDPSVKSWASWRMPSWINNIVFPDGRQDEEISDMASDMSEEKFNQEVGADFTEFVGRVFKDFDEEIHVKDLKYDSRYPLYAAVDYGWTNPFVWLLVQTNVWDDIFVLAEYRAINKDINDICRDLQAHEINGMVKRFYPDPAEPGDTAVISKRLRIPSAANTGGELKWRLELIRQKLMPQPLNQPPEKREPKLYINRRCVDLIREMQDYRYPDTPEESMRAAPEEPIKKDDHGPEALGRFMRGYFGGPGDGMGHVQPRVRKANVG